MEKIYLLVNINNYEYARFSHTGTWVKFKEFCPICTTPTTILSEPLIIEWDPGSNVIGDFSWCGYTMIIKDKVKQFLLDNNYACRFGEVLVNKNGSYKANMKGVSYPYKGPHISWLIPKIQVNLDVNKSGLTTRINCEFCGYKDYDFKMNGIVIPEFEVRETKIFKIKQFGLSAATYITEKALNELVTEGFSNLHFFEAGYTSNKS